MLVKLLIQEFSQILNVSYSPPAVFFTEMGTFLKSLQVGDLVESDLRRRRLIAHINEKFKFNSEEIASFLSLAANLKISFNYHDKKCISQAYDLCDNQALINLLFNTKKITHDSVQLLASKFSPLSVEKTMEKFWEQLKTPTLSRKDSKPRDWSTEILSSLFSAYVYSSFPEEVIHAITDPLKKNQEYQADFWSHLHKNCNHSFSRENALTVFKLSQKSWDHELNFLSYRNKICALIAQINESISNHGYFAVIVDSITKNGESITWKLYADIVLYAEKHLLSNSKQLFFRSKDIEKSTSEYIPQIDIRKADFSSFNTGLFYKDCFVIGSEHEQKILILFQKNQADETVIPCPTCRSHRVQGNSYSSLGVRSWECKSVLCPDRSKFNRGKRYSFLQILKHKALDDAKNSISLEEVRKWSKDVQPLRSDAEILAMLLQQYSLHGDGVCLYDWSTNQESLLGRSITLHKINDSNHTKYRSEIIPVNKFSDSQYFHRYFVQANQTLYKKEFLSTEVSGVRAYLGNSFEVLQNFSENCIDGAVTSPPYYNAREYSQWENIYTYLYDMYNINKQVFKVLKPGAYYLFNIFDYFDNERNISLSAMGEKRMILGAYIIDMFERIGFKCNGNIIWDKGDIEGKRGFNQGNFSPYYQAPFNCWEHILVFRKPGNDFNSPITFPNIIQQRPVMKMVRGINTHGHSAPYPEAIPTLLSKNLRPGSIILDPFAGSMTTGYSATKYDCNAVCIEQNEEYYNLGVKILGSINLTCEC